MFREIRYAPFPKQPSNWRRYCIIFMILYYNIDLSHILMKYVFKIIVNQSVAIFA